MYRSSHMTPMLEHCIQRTVNDSTTPSRIYINNGSSTHMSIPCFYLPKPPKFHSRKRHDHYGWPRPDHPDRSCQAPRGGWLPTRKRKIDFFAEGYTDGYIAFANKPSDDELFANVRFSTKDCNVIDLDIEVNSKDHIDKPGVYRFAVHVCQDGPHTIRRRVQRGTSFEVVEDRIPAKDDIVYLGELVVLPAGLGNQHHLQ